MDLTEQTVFNEILSSGALPTFIVILSNCVRKTTQIAKSI